MILKKHYFLLAELLRLSSERAANRACDDLDITQSLPDSSDRQDLAEEMHQANGDPENFDPDEDYSVMSEAWLAGYFSRLIEKLATSDSE